MKKILITGASSGVGLSLARRYADTEMEVILLARRAEEIRESAFSKHENVYAYSVNLASIESTRKIIDKVLAKHGRIDYLINCAGVLTQKQLSEIELEELEYSINLNALSPLLIIQKLLPKMKENNFGRIINVTSGAPLNCFPGVGAYSSSKAMLNALTVTLAKEYFEFNIKINLMSPGPVRSEMSPNAELLPEICHPTVDYLLNLDESGPTGGFFWLGYKVPLFPDLSGVDWLNGIGNEKLEKIL